jgi:hypothetical protein
MNGLNTRITANETSIAGLEEDLDANIDTIHELNDTVNNYILNLQFYIPAFEIIVDDEELAQSANLNVPIATLGTGGTIALGVVTYPHGYRQSISLNSDTGMFTYVNNQCSIKYYGPSGLPVKVYVQLEITRNPPQFDEPIYIMIRKTDSNNVPIGPPQKAIKVYGDVGNVSTVFTDTHTNDVYSLFVVQSILANNSIKLNRVIMGVQMFDVFINPPLSMQT